MLCRICSSKNLDLVIDLGMQPWGNHFLKKGDCENKKKLYPLKLVFCQNCNTSQLDFTVKKEIMFSNHTYLSGITKSLSDHFKTVSKIVDKTFFSNVKVKSALDIGSNDGTQLKQYKNLGYKVLGIESSKRTSKIANQNGIKTINKFFNFKFASKLNEKFDVINASGVFYHLEELHSVTEGIKKILKDNGIFIVQFIYMKLLLENLAFDQIYHEHLLYYNLRTINKLLNMHGLEMFDSYLSNIHGGSVIGYITHKGNRKITKRLTNMMLIEDQENSNNFLKYLEFSKKVKKLKKDNIQFLRESKNQNKTIYGMGAPVKGNTLLNYFKIGKDILDCLVEKNYLRKGLYSPGQCIPIIMENEIKILPDIYYVLAWNFKNEILKNNKNIIKKRIKFYFPINPKGI
jgi:SAM-dependent methyltransferase